MKRVLVVAGVVVVVVVLLLWKLRGNGEHGSSGGSAAHANAASVRAGGSAPLVKLDPASVAGRVISKLDGKAIPGAYVSLARAEISAEVMPQDTPTIVVTTNAAGEWRAEKVAPGTYNVTASAKGMLPASIAKLAVGSGEQKAGVELVLEAGGTIVRGTVSDQLGGTIEGARITVITDIRKIQRESQIVTLTGADGKYEVSLPEGIFHMVASHEDYTNKTKNLQVADKPLVVDFTLVPGSSIRGQVIARDTGKPVPQAVVHGEVRRDSDEDAIADDDGKFVLKSLRGGAIAVTAAGRGYASVAPIVVEIGIGEQVDGIQVYVDRAFTISGRVVKKGTQQGVPGVAIGAFTFQSDQSLPSTTDNDGAFALFGARPGSYMMFAAVEGMLLEIGKNVEVVDKDVTDVVIEMQAGVTISGRVEPAAVAKLSLELDGEVGIANMFEMIKTMLAVTDSDATGAFTLRNAPVGKFKLVARTKDGRTGKLPITIADADQSGLVVQLEPRGSIAGRVIDTTGAPVPGMGVRAQATGGSFSLMVPAFDERHTSGPDGSYWIGGLETGDYTLHAESPDELFIEEQLVDAKPVTLAKGEAKTGVTITVPARNLTIRGIVVGSDHKPVGDAWVSARRQADAGATIITHGDDDPDDDSWGTTEPVLTGDDGKFTIPKLPAGIYKIVAEGPRGGSRGAKTGVKAGEAGVVIELRSLGSLLVHVTATGKPVTVFDVECRGPTTITRRASAADGTYTLEHMPPGEYTCKVSAEAGNASSKVTVGEALAKLDLELVAWSSITGTVVSVLTGEPVPGLVTMADTADTLTTVITGDAPKTDAKGRFVVPKVPAGPGNVVIYKGGFDVLARRDYTAVAGQRTDVGTIKVMPPRKGEPGTLGLTVMPDEDKLDVIGLVEDGPAARAGIVGGDRVTAIDGHDVKEIGLDTAANALSAGNVGVGETRKLTLARGATVSLTAVKWP